MRELRSQKVVILSYTACEINARLKSWLTGSRAVVLKHCRALESPGDFKKVSMPELHPSANEIKIPGDGPCI